MIKWFITVSGAVFVLVSGLVSCSADKKSRDVYHAPAPVIRDGSRSQGLREFDTNAQREVDLQSTLDMAQARPSRFRVRSQCRAGQTSYSAEFEFAGLTEVALFQILPEDVLFLDLKTVHAECSFELNLYNAEGSNHIFNIASIPVVETRAPAVQLKNEASDTPAPDVLRLILRLEGLRFRYDNHATASSQVICADMVLPPLPFDQVDELAHIDLSAITRRLNRADDILQAKPQQTCRVAISSAGQRLAVSAPFVLLMPRAPLPARKVSEAQRWQGHACLGWGPLLADGQEVLFQTWEISNNSPWARTLRFSKSGWLGEVAFVAESWPGSGSPMPNVKTIGICSSRVLYLRPHRDSVPPINEDDTQVTLRLEPGQTLLADFVIWGRGTFRTPTVNAPQMRITPTETPTYVELSDTLEEVSRTGVPVDSTLSTFFQDDRELVNLPRVPEYNCSWK